MGRERPEKVPEGLSVTSCCSGYSLSKVPLPDWKCGSSHSMLAYKTQRSEFKPQYHKKNKRKRKRSSLYMDMWGTFMTQLGS
jgi:hypothetical protein